MLLSILTSEGDIGYKILILLVATIALLPALTVHEWAHGFAAYKLGDSTAKADGRLSLNPLDHIDPIGSIMLLLLGFGWAKPVPVITRNFKKPRRDFAIVAFAGPLSNFIIAFFSAFLYVLAESVCKANGWDGNITAQVIVEICRFSMIYNIGLGSFNLIPIPPLDGSNIVMCILPNRLASKYAKLRYYTHYIFIGLIVLRYLPFPLNLIPNVVFLPLDFARNIIEFGFKTFFELIINPFFL